MVRHPRRWKYSEPTRNFPEYKIWVEMKCRCFDITRAACKHYGGRGIKVCDRWNADDGFAAFIEDMGRRPSPKHQLDRIDNNGDYEPGNCRWVVPVAQARNRRSNRKIEFRGEAKILVEWCEALGLNYQTVYCRLFTYGWDTEKAFTEPVKPRTNKI